MSQLVFLAAFASHGYKSITLYRSALAGGPSLGTDFIDRHTWLSERGDDGRWIEIKISDLTDNTG